MDKMILQELQKFAQHAPQDDRDFYTLLKLAACCACYRPAARLHRKPRRRPQNRRAP